MSAFHQEAGKVLFVNFGKDRKEVSKVSVANKLFGAINDVVLTII